MQVAYPRPVRAASSQRWLAAALVTSAAAHGLGAWWLWRMPPVRLAGVEATAEEAAVEVQVLASAAPAGSPAPRPREAPRPSRPPEPEPMPGIVPGTSVEVDMPLTAPPAQDPPPRLKPAGAPTLPAGSVVSDSSGELAGRGAGTLAPTAGPGASSELAARLAAAALRCYPAAAVRFRLRGEALVSFCLGEDGAARSAGVVRSSGSPLLDRAALECVLPGALPVAGAAGCYELPVHFAPR
jgi:protein TonB